jgi:hypothetical protein
VNREFPSSSAAAAARVLASSTLALSVDDARAGTTPIIIVATIASVHRAKTSFLPHHRPRGRRRFAATDR